MKILFFIGKGGVGKSSCSAVFAVKLASAGKTVLLNSIDPAHNLHDIFKTKLSSKPKKIINNLNIMETNLNNWIKIYLKNTEDSFKSVYKYQEAFNLHKYFKTLKYSPGLEEYAILLALSDTIKKYNDNDYIIFDTPPTALTIKFLALPDITLLWLKELSKFRKLILNKKEIITRIKKGEETQEKDQVLSKLKFMSEDYQNLAKNFKDTNKTSIIIITNPDKLSLCESLSISQELNNLNIPYPFIILNKYCGEDQCLKKLKTNFSNSKIVEIYKQKYELIGLEKLKSVNLSNILSEI
jgi:arsenite/tail-anchored protein-transporting ATPase